MKSKLLIFLCIGFVSAFIVSFLYILKIDFLTSFDLKLKDVRFRLRGNLEPDRRVLIVAIDSKSIDRLGRWPWDRKIIAKLIENLKKAKVIALDIVFSEVSNPQADRILSETVNKNAVVGYYFRDDETYINPRSYENLRESRIKIIKTEQEVKTLPVREFAYAELNIPSIKTQAGFFNIFPDNDGVYRKIALLALYNGELYPHLALKAVAQFKEVPVIVEIAQYGIKSIKIGYETAPVDESGSLTLNYYGKAGTFKTVSAVDVIDGNVQIPEDSIIFIGATEIGIADIRSTPVDPVMPGVEISATAVSNILKNQYLIYNAWVTLVDILFITVPAILLSFIFIKVSRTFLSLTIFMAFSFLTYFVNLFIFKNYFLDLSLIYPFVALSLCYVLSEAYRNLIIEKKSRFLKKAFSSYVSPEVVNIIMKNPDALKLGGEKRTITVLFSDVRGFTTVSEQLKPEKLVLLLNSYLDPMTKIVLKHRGMLDKYIGDAIMALYNAPVEFSEHAKEAVLTAIEMTKELKNLNEKFIQYGFPEIDIGIGINTGEAVIGNMGTDMRFDYTAIGDTVNLASRLEGLNKFYGTRIIISESTFNALKQKKEFIIRELDLIRVKGKKEPVKIYEVIENLAFEPAIKDFEKALNLYRNFRFKEAIEIFSYIKEKFNDKASSVYEERCKAYLQNPPASDWDKVYTAREK
ncbi:adenylate/guanylate cyclase domain-containing protein [Thermodesulfovibrio sp. 3907-1M]|uniref:Adenylate/guanylate cyclase domain-containing protein n=1 Tax=Thermodesulfovibrio autotrophicus TaxID=3118333 RepID=A0AAU8GU68_9BACT